VHQCLGMGLARFEANSLLPYLFTISNQFEIKETKYERDFGVVVFNKITNLTLRKK
jgi:cytochrome P450